MLADELRGMAPCRTEWITLDAARVKAFADTTEDWQGVHLDADVGRQAGFDGAIAHGFLTLSMLSSMAYQVFDGLSGYKTSVNYGFDRVRFVAPVTVGSRIRGHFSVAGVDEGDGWLNVQWDVSVEIEGKDRPALAAAWITRLYLN